MRRTAILALATLALTPDGAQGVGSPGSVLYRHRLTPGTAGSLTFALTPGAGSPLRYQLWQDVNGDGASRGFEKLGCARMGGRRLGASRSESCWTATVDEERARRRSMPA